MIFTIGCIWIINVWKESENTNDSSLTIISISILGEKFINLWFNICLFSHAQCHLRNGFSSTFTVIWYWVLIFFTISISPNFYCWVTLDSKTVCKDLLNCTVYFTEFYLAGYLLCCFFPFRLKCFAMATPWSIKFNEPNVFRLHYHLIKIFIS